MINNNNVIFVFLLYKNYHMKTFIKQTFSRFLSLVIFFIFSIVIVMCIAFFFSDKEDFVISEDSILKIEFNKPILDRTSENPLSNLNLLDLSNESSVELRDLLENIDKARSNENIKGIYMLFSSFSAGLSQVEEIREKLLEFKESGKSIYAYSESFSQTAYYLASVADKIYLNPEGTLEIRGFSAQVIFYKSFLQKIGLDMQVIRHGKYKSAVEPYMYDKMSVENRIQLESLLNSIAQKMVLSISESRKVEENIVHNLMNEEVFLNASKSVKNHLIDEALYEDQVLENIQKTVNNYNMINYEDFEKVTFRNKLSQNKIAIIYATGPINLGKGDFESIGSETTVKAIKEAVEDENVKSIVLRINSPGGSALASDIIWRSIDLAKETKKVVVSMGDYAASGGYYIACNAHKVFANASTITGSIGVFGVIPSGQDFLNNKLGIYVDTVNTHKSSDALSGFRKLTDYERDILRNSIQDVYETFISRVANGRDMLDSEADKIAQGRVWSGIDALNVGLVDEIGGLDKAVKSAALLSGISSDYRVITLPKKEDFIEEILNDFSNQSNVDLLKILGVDEDFIDQFNFLSSDDKIQARLPFFMHLE